MGTPPIHTPRAALPYVANDKDVSRGNEMIARARSHSMAKRIAYALNKYAAAYKLNEDRRKKS
jgi:hypothetical protein